MYFWYCVRCISHVIREHLVTCCIAMHCLITKVLQSNKAEGAISVARGNSNCESCCIALSGTSRTRTWTLLNRVQVVVDICLFDQCVQSNRGVVVIKLGSKITPLVRLTASCCCLCFSNIWRACRLRGNLGLQQLNCKMKIRMRMKIQIDILIQIQIQINAAFGTS